MKLVDQSIFGVVEDGTVAAFINLELALEEVARECRNGELHFCDEPVSDVLSASEEPARLRPRRIDVRNIRAIL